MDDDVMDDYLTREKLMEPIDDPRYWKDRLDNARSLHHAIYLTNQGDWDRIEAKHRQILKATIEPNDSVLDAGCGWGRLLTLMPGNWIGRYLGVDHSPDFLELARKQHPFRTFVQSKLEQLPFGVYQGFDWAVLISIRDMIRNNRGQEAWDNVETELRRCVKKILYLEYDSTAEGSVE